MQVKGTVNRLGIYGNGIAAVIIRQDRSYPEFEEEIFVVTTQGAVTEFMPGTRVSVVVTKDVDDGTE